VKLTDLDASFRVITETDAEGELVSHRPGTFAEAHGVMFLCPKCFAANGGAVGTHAVICWSSSRGVADTIQPGPGRWKLEGTSIKDLTLGCEPGKSRSVALQGGCAWHGFVTNGDAT
jgi:hypothetical protein